MARLMQVQFMFFAVLKNLKSSFSDDNVPERALDIFIENATKMVCIFLCNVMITKGVRQGTSKMHSGMMDTVFHSCDALDSMPQN